MGQNATDSMHPIELIIQIQSYQDMQFAGRYILPGAKGQSWVYFENTMQLFLEIQKISQSQIEYEPITYNTHDGAPCLETFRVKIFFFQNASWQGTLLWQKKKETVAFRSELELLRLMDSALYTNDEL